MEIFNSVKPLIPVNQDGLLELLIQCSVQISDFVDLFPYKGKIFIFPEMLIVRYVEGIGLYLINPKVYISTINLINMQRSHIKPEETLILPGQVELGDRIDPEENINFSLELFEPTLGQ